MLLVHSIVIYFSCLHPLPVAIAAQFASGNSHNSAQVNIRSHVLYPMVPYIGYYTAKILPNRI